MITKEISQVGLDLKEFKILSQQFSVLYVEDEKKIRDSIAIYLKNFFNIVDTANDGAKGLELFKRNHYDIVITDILMPKMNGLDMAREIKEINPNQNILIISAYAEVANFVYSIKIGIDGYIIKPVDYKQMNSILYKIVYKLKESKEKKLYRIELEQLVKEKVKETELEKEKFAYYFKDQVRGLYDRDYLTSVLFDNNLKHKYFDMSILTLNNFHDYAKINSWEKRNEFIEHFSSYLQHTYSDSVIFRIRGIDFIIISTQQLEIDIKEIYELDILKDSGIQIGLKNLDIDKKHINSIDDLIKVL
ncbi:MAG: response regulator [Arcobacteraceae bacterium]|nr:response regulator [Arcobacteraceae bacterium]